MNGEMRNCMNRREKKEDDVRIGGVEGKRKQISLGITREEGKSIRRNDMAVRRNKIDYQQVKKWKVSTIKARNGRIMSETDEWDIKLLIS